jgi:5-methylcytosine-specific restriction endonuclease McrBC GTP-binding regulatory subunit McrB
LHENTGKEQSEHFKTKLKKGDFVYITLGSKELIGIAKVVSEEWEYVPEEIVDAVGWMFREVEFIKAPDRKNPKDLKETKNIFPSGNSTLTEIKSDALGEANEKLFKPYFNVEFIEEGGTTITSSKTIMSKSPLNQILYGPPGTGKTYNTVLEAAKIVTGNENISYDDALKVFNENLNNQIEFITFHQNYSYEDFIQGIRPDTDNGKELSFEKKDGVFKRIADRALFEYYIENQKVKSKAKPNEIFVDANEAYLDFFASLKVGQQFSTKTKKTISIIKLRNNKNIVFKYESGSKPVLVSSNRLLKLYGKISNIKEIVNINVDVRTAIGGCDATIYYTVLNEFINFYEDNKKRIQNEEDYQDIDYLDVTEERKREILSQITLNELRSVDKNKVKNYVIIIDEINRANISRVFWRINYLN